MHIEIPRRTEALHGCHRTCLRGRLGVASYLSEVGREGAIDDANTSQFFEATAKHCNDAKLSANWLMGEVAAAIIEDKGLKQVSDTGAIEAMIDEVINNGVQQADPKIAPRC